MSQKKTSKEEHYLLKLHEMASAKGGPKNEVDRYKVGEAIGESPKGVDHTVQILTKNGMTKKTDERHVQLTDFGLKVIKQYLYPSQ
jgi:Mn-dependent DtxR family transcriptional regulator